MADYSIFDVMGPIMIGPSSSHTAGAARIGRLAKKICGKDFTKVVFHLHGSFAKTYMGHGTDKALVAGALGMLPDDENLRDSFEIAKKRNVNYSFEQVDLGDVHPNSVKVEMFYEDGRVSYVIGSSIGGGNIKIIDIDGLKIDFTNAFPTLILKYNEQKGIISFVSTLLAENEYNIEKMITEKNNGIVTLLVEIDKELTDEMKSKILHNERFILTKYIAGDY
jgi:L-serine dehydratase, iron-sulfur-dependent, beta subunit